jgi:hypothetical protein
MLCKVGYSKRNVNLPKELGFNLSPTAEDIIIKKMKDRRMEWTKQGK